MITVFKLLFLCLTVNESLDYNMIISIISIAGIKESVDSISRDGMDTPIYVMQLKSQNTLFRYIIKL